MNYDVDYFIKKFEAIPERKWTTNKFKTGNLFWAKYCAMGHCGAREGEMYTPKEATALLDLFYPYPIDITSINDGHSIRYMQPTPKERVLAALYDLKNGKLEPHDLYLEEENFKPQEEVLEIV